MLKFASVSDTHSVTEPRSSTKTISLKPIAGLLGFTGISAGSADIARFLFYVFVVIFLVLLVLGLTIFRV